MSQIKKNMDLDFRTRRVKARLTLKDVSKETGITIALLSQYEREMIKPGLKNLLTLDNFLKSKGV